jgi:protein-histidine pros-kinase
LTPDQDKQLRTVQGSARHLLALINDLLDVAKIEAGKVELDPQAVDCVEVIEEVAATLRPQAESKGLTLVVDVPGQAMTLHTDRRALSQIVINLTNNAIKFTERGTIALTLRHRRDGEGRLMEISVEDTGIGVPAEDQAKLFTAFSRGTASQKKTTEGTGLGLHLSQKLAAVLGGNITFTSEHGKGSTFTLVLPTN